MNKCYIVKASGGQYDDAWECNIKVFLNEDAANAHAAELQSEVPEYSQQFSDEISDIHSSLHLEFSGKYRHLGERWYHHKDAHEEHKKLLDERLQLIREKYPNKTDNEYEADVEYSVEEIDFEG